MKGKNIGLKAVAVILSVFCIFGTLAVLSFAEDSGDVKITVTEKNLGGKYGDIVPTDKNLKALKTKYTFYGDSTMLYFMVFSKGQSTSNCAVEIYSKSSCAEDSLVTSYSNSLGKSGSRSLSINWKFKKIHSGKYYGKSYIYTESNGKKTVDTTTVRTFTVTVNRVGKQTVKLSSVKNGNGFVTVSWAELPSATKYRIYRKLSGDKEWTTVANIKSGNSSYKDTTAKSGKKYIYTVKAYDGSYASLYNKTGLSVLYLAAPALKSVNGSGTSGVPKITWGKVSGAKGYYVYRKGGSLSNSDWIKIATVSAGTTSYTDKKGTSTDWKYNYTVKAYNGKTASASKGSLEFNYLKAPSVNSLKLTVDGITVKWKDTNNLKYKYKVYRKASGDKNWTAIATVSDLSFTDTTVKSGKKYTYTVKSVYKTNSGAYNGTGKTTAFLGAPSASLTVSGDGIMNIKWKAVSGAKGYYVYRKTADTSWVKIATIKSGKTVSYTDNSKKVSGTEYYYTVKSYNDSVASSHYNTKAYTLYLESVTLTAENTAEGIKLCRTSSSGGAESYNIYKKSSEGEKVLLFENTAEEVFTDTEVTPGENYKYSIEAVCGKYTSSDTSVKINCVGIPVVTDAVCTEDGVKVLWETVPGADAYYIYRKTVDGEWTAIGSYSLNEFTDTDDGCTQTKYFYTVGAAMGTDKGYFDQTGVSNFINEPAVTAEFALVGEESEKVPTAKVTWNNDLLIDSYELYKTAKDGEPVLLGTFTKDDIKHEEETVTYDECFIYEDAELTQGVSYTYTVKAVKDGKFIPEVVSDSVKWDFPPIEAVSFELFKTEGTPATEETEAVSGGIIVKWSPVEFASSYEILRKCNAEDDWAVVATVEKSAEEIEFYTYTDSTILRDTEYIYTVKGVADDRDSEFDTEGISVILYTPSEGVAPALELVNIGSEEAPVTAVKITWGQVTGAAVYEIYRKTADTEWTFVDSFLIPAENVCTDENIECNTEYFYKVVAKAFDRTVNQDEEGASIIWEV